MATPKPVITGKGLLYVTSRLGTDILDEKTYLKWYDEDHIVEILNTSGMKSAFRYRDVDIEAKTKRKEKVYLAFYPMDDLAFTQGDEFRNIRVKSDMLPGTGIIYDMAEFDVRYLGLIHKTEPTNDKKGATACMITFGIEPGQGQSDEEIEKWFREEHISAAANLKGYKRTTLYHLQYARTNEQSRALKGLPARDVPAPEPPTYLAMHEFEEVVSFPHELESTPSAEKILGGAKQVEKAVYRLAKALGNGYFFQ